MNPPPVEPELRLEAVIVCVGFDDILDITLGLNHPHLDTAIVVTTHQDGKTQLVAKKHAATCVLTDLTTKDNRHFNKGAAINAGFGYFRYNGWRLHLDADIALPDNFRRVLFNHTSLDKSAIYGADRVNVIVKDGSELAANRAKTIPQQSDYFVIHGGDNKTEHRFVTPLFGYVPIGYFQLWHADCQKPYPYSVGTAEHDDVLFATLWPSAYRRLLPTVIVDHLVRTNPKLGENWDGRTTERLEVKDVKK